MADAGRHEQVPRHFINGVKYGKIVYALIVQLLDQTPTRSAIVWFYGCCHHVPADASMA
jgi:hypothetical protein